MVQSRQSHVEGANSRAVPCLHNNNKIAIPSAIVFQVSLAILLSEMNNIMRAVSQGDSFKFIHQNWSIPQMNPHTQGEGHGSRYIGPVEGGRKNCSAGVDQIVRESLKCN